MRNDLGRPRRISKNNFEMFVRMCRPTGFIRVKIRAIGVLLAPLFPTKNKKNKKILDKPSENIDYSAQSNF